MNFFFRLAGATALAALLALPTFAGPGAHGPNGEHLDGPAQSATPSALPRLEAVSESFELVATLGGGELSILVDRFDSNEPVLDAKVEVDADGRKAVARFHGDHGDYAIDDPAFVQALERPGEHALVFTIAAGAQADLLDGTLRVAPAGAPHEHAPALSRPLAATGAALLLAAAAGVFFLRRRRAAAGAPR